MQDCLLPLPYNAFQVYWGECRKRMAWEIAGGQHSYEVLMLTTEQQNQSWGGRNLLTKNRARRTTG